MALYRDFAPAPGLLPPGQRNTITDAPGVHVGHVTIRRGAVNTGVTAVVPQPGNLFRSKLTAAVEVINGFGKSAGRMQLAELGTLETPILLTNTFAVAPCITALIRRAIAEDPAIGRETSTVNAVVGECNDGLLSDIQALAVTEADAHAALAAAAPDLEQGSVGGSTGMTSLGFKGGIGSASRAVPGGHLGVLVQANFGNAGDLVLPDGRRPDPRAPYAARSPTAAAASPAPCTTPPLRAASGRLERRLCGGGGRRRGLCRARHRYRLLDPLSGALRRHRRHETRLRPAPHHRHPAARPDPRSYRRLRRDRGRYRCADLCLRGAAPGRGSGTGHGMRSGNQRRL